jgi:hypothetical protein
MKAQTVPDARGLVPGIHDLLTASKTWMAGHERVYARLSTRYARP